MGLSGTERLRGFWIDELADIPASSKGERKRKCEQGHNPGFPDAPSERWESIEPAGIIGRDQPVTLFEPLPRIVLPFDIHTPESV